jgi:hypothetical protein
MAAAALLFRFNADASGLKSGVSTAKSELDKLSESASSVGNRLVAALPPSIGVEAKKIGGAVGSLAGAFGGLGGVMAGLGIGAIANDFLDTTSRLTDLSAQTDITIRDLQRFQYAGDLVGVSLDSITTAVSQLQNRLGSGDKGAFSAIDQLGLSLRELQRLDPGQQFEVIASALSRVSDANKRAALAQDLFGRGFITLMPLLRSSLKDTADQAFVLSDATVKAGDAAGDTITKFMNFGKVLIGNVLTPAVRWAEDLQDAIADVGRTIDVVRGQMGTLPTISAPTGFGGNGGLRDITMSMAEAERVADELNRKIATQLVKSQEEAARKAREAAQAYRELTASAQELIERGIDRQIAAERELFGQSVQSGLIASLRSTREELLVTLPVMSNWAAANQATTQTLHEMVAAGLTLPPVTEEQRRKFLEVKDSTVSWRDSLADLAQAMTQLAQTSNNALVNALGSMVNGVNVGIKAFDSLKKGMDDLTSGGGLKSILSGFTGIVGGIGGLVSAVQAAISIGKTLFGLFDRDKGRDLVENFVKQFGGFDRIQDIFAGMGDEGHRLWVMLTQGVGRNNPEQARRAIEEVHIPVKFDVEMPNIPAMAAGGIVNRPTLALIGEAGPEAVVPLGQLGSVSGSDKATLSEIQGMRSDLKRLPDVLFRSIRDAYQTA